MLDLRLVSATGFLAGRLSFIAAFPARGDTSASGQSAINSLRTVAGAATVDRIPSSARQWLGIVDGEIIPVLPERIDSFSMSTGTRTD